MSSSYYPTVSGEFPSSDGRQGSPIQASRFVSFGKMQPLNSTRISEAATGFSTPVGQGLGFPSMGNAPAMGILSPMGTLPPMANIPPMRNVSPGGNMPPLGNMPPMGTVSPMGVPDKNIFNPMSPTSPVFFDGVQTVPAIVVNNRLLLINLLEELSSFDSALSRDDLQAAAASGTRAEAAASALASAAVDPPYGYAAATRRLVRGIAADFLFFPGFCAAWRRGLMNYPTLMAASNRRSSHGSSIVLKAAALIDAAGAGGDEVMFDLLGSQLDYFLSSGDTERAYQTATIARGLSVAPPRSRPTDALDRLSAGLAARAAPGALQSAAEAALTKFDLLRRVFRGLDLGLTPGPSEGEVRLLLAAAAARSRPATARALRSLDPLAAQCAVCGDPTLFEAGAAGLEGRFLMSMRRRRLRRGYDRLSRYGILDPRLQGRVNHLLSDGFFRYAYVKKFNFNNKSCKFRHLTLTSRTIFVQPRFIPATSLPIPRVRDDPTRLGKGICRLTRRRKDAERCRVWLRD